MIGLRGGTPIEQTEHAVAAPPGYEDTEDIRLGDLLRGERATLGKSLLDVQRELRIRASYVAAIENCDITPFDAPSFVPGYVRSYARYLGMDGDWVFQRFCSESGFQPTHANVPVSAGGGTQTRGKISSEPLAGPNVLFIPQPNSFLSSIEPRAVGSVLVMVLLACGLGYGGWTVLQEVQRVNLTPGEQAPGVIASLDPVQDAIEPSSFDNAALNLPKPEGFDRVYRPQVLEVPVLTARDGPISAIDPGAVNTAATVAQVQRSESGQDRLATVIGSRVTSAGLDIGLLGPVFPADQAAVRTVAQNAPEVELLAVRPAWVRVTSSDGTVLLEKTMDAGERFALPQLEGAPVLRTGNSGAIYFGVNGRTYGPAAPGAQVVKNVELSPSALTAKFAFADLTKDPELAEMIAVALVERPADSNASGETVMQD